MHMCNGHAGPGGARLLPTVQALWWMGQREAHDIAVDVRGGGGGGGGGGAPHGWGAYRMPCGLSFFVHRDAGVATMSRPRGEAGFARGTLALTLTLILIPILTRARGQPSPLSNPNPKPNPNLHPT